MSYTSTRKGRSKVNFGFCSVVGGEFVGILLDSFEECESDR